MSTRTTFASGAIACLMAVAGPASAQETLERALVLRAPELVKSIQMHKTVGVLKFLVARGENAPFSDNVGALNMLLAERVETALLMAIDKEKPINFIKNASAVANEIRGANHLTQKGREVLFAHDYPLAWGKVQHKPDAFIIGETRISNDLKSLEITLKLFDRTSTDPLRQLAPTFRVRNRSVHLAEIGESFMSRSLPDGSKEDDVENQIFIEAVKARAKGAHPADPEQQKKAPVQLEIRYNGVPVAMKYENGKAYVREPMEKEKVELVLRRDNTEHVYGVVLKVNGENTIMREKQPDTACRAWVLPKGARESRINGYLLLATDPKSNETKAKIDHFKVASAAESKELEIRYGEDTGTITMTVFRNSSVKPATFPKLTLEAKVVAVAELDPVPNAQEAENFEAYLEKIKDLRRGFRGLRGVITGGGGGVDTNVGLEEFHRDPQPIMSLTIVYYKGSVPNVSK